MRQPLIAGNWKMNTSLEEGLALARSLKARLDGLDGVEVALCPPFISLAPIRELLGASSLGLGAQNMHYQEKGAFTGEVSPAMLRGLCRYVILGHSERRQQFGESDELVNKKVRAALAWGLDPILCVGERLEENEAGRTEEVVSFQLRAALDGVASLGGTVIAYEPVWAIGTGRAATGAQANATIGLLRGLLSRLYGPQVAQEVRLLYGGSVTAANIAEFVSQPEVDGALVGGASLQAEEFISIAQQTARIRGGA